MPRPRARLSRLERLSRAVNDGRTEVAAWRSSSPVVGRLLHDRTALTETPMRTPCGLGSPKQPPACIGALEGAEELLSKLRRYARSGPDKRPDPPVGPAGWRSLQPG